ncbi:hypothetical protein N7455_004308 [Penicillium solitum]|uniref:uncharacterized protein n=1 Tax=Penicillium solitum TaxID=60172 RepID=UPI0032C45B12|nr:hypothetical protein N7455_004308 [Penicillium solitum]
MKDTFDLIFVLTTIVSGGVANLPDGTPSLDINPAGTPGSADVKRSLPRDDMLTSTVNAARDNTLALVSRHLMKNMRSKNGTRSRDYEFHHFADRTSYTHASLLKNNNTTSTITKRHDGAGIKVVFSRTGIAVSKDEYLGASAAIASAWDKHTEAGNSDFYRFTERMMANGGKKAVLY